MIKIPVSNAVEVDVAMLYLSHVPKPPSAGFDMGCVFAPFLTTSSWLKCPRVTPNASVELLTCRSNELYCRR